jgi:hypothetical protein
MVARCARQRHPDTRLDYCIDLLRLSRVCFVLTAHSRRGQEFLLCLEKKLAGSEASLPLFFSFTALGTVVLPASISLIPMLWKNQCNIRSVLLSPDRCARLKVFRSPRKHRSQWDHHRSYKGNSRHRWFRKSNCRPNRIYR